MEPSLPAGAAAELKAGRNDTKTDSRNGNS